MQDSMTAKNNDTAIISTTLRLPESLWMEFRGVALQRRTTAQDQAIAAFRLYLESLEKTA